jgi:hypothetical protein
MLSLHTLSYWNLSLLSGGAAYDEKSTLLLLWPGEDSAELADGPRGRGKVAKDGGSFAWNISVTRTTTVLTEAERINGPITTLSQH